MIAEKVNANVTECIMHNTVHEALNINMCMINCKKELNKKLKECYVKWFTVIKDHYLERDQ